MSRMDRIREYVKSTAGPSGASRDQENLDYWSRRASRNSYHGGKSRESDTSYIGAKQDKNNSGSSLMPKVRREA